MTREPEQEGLIDTAEDRLIDRLVDDAGMDAGAALSAELLDHLLAAENETDVRQLLAGPALALVDEGALATSLENAVFAFRVDAELSGGA